MSDQEYHTSFCSDKIRTQQSAAKRRPVPLNQATDSSQPGAVPLTLYNFSTETPFARAKEPRATRRMGSSAPFSITAQALHDDIRHTRKLSLGCAVLDRVMGGGIDVQGITEVAGSAGAGKTQLVLRCLLHVQLPPSEGGLSGGAIYIFSEGSSQPSMRLPVLTRPRAAVLHRATRTTHAPKAPLLYARCTRASLGHALRTARTVAPQAPATRARGRVRRAVPAPRRDLAVSDGEDRLGRGGRARAADAAAGDHRDRGAPLAPDPSAPHRARTPNPELAGVARDHSHSSTRHGAPVHPSSATHAPGALLGQLIVIDSIAAVFRADDTPDDPYGARDPPLC